LSRRRAGRHGASNSRTADRFLFGNSWRSSRWNESGRRHATIAETKTEESIMKDKALALAAITLALWDTVPAFTRLKEKLAFLLQPAI
jgi:hypothetical protein